MVLEYLSNTFSHAKRATIFNDDRDSQPKGTRYYDKNTASSLLRGTLLAGFSLGVFGVALSVGSLIYKPLLAFMVSQPGALSYTYGLASLSLFCGGLPMWFTAAVGWTIVAGFCCLGHRMAHDKWSEKVAAEVGVTGQPQPIAPLRRDLFAGDTAPQGKIDWERAGDAFRLLVEQAITIQHQVTALEALVNPSEGDKQEISAITYDKLSDEEADLALKTLIVRVPKLKDMAKNPTVAQTFDISTPLEKEKNDLSNKLTTKGVTPYSPEGQQNRPQRRGSTPGGM